MGPLTSEIMLKALKRLDELLLTASDSQEIKMIMGGGGAMILAHQFPLGTADIDAITQGIEMAELDVLVKQISQEQSIPTDWLNPYFSTFSHTLPDDYGSRLIQVFQGVKLRTQALGKEEMLIMKCFAHRRKDVGHARALIKKGANLEVVENQIELLRKKGIPGADAAIEFLDDVLDQLG